MTIEIKNRFTERVIYSSEKPTLKEALEEAVSNKVVLDYASLDGASLDGASLDGASLDGASLVRASLVRASLDGASLDGASLARASLDGASLDGASLDGASLVRASLDGASLDGASLARASLDGASLDGASLDGASLESINWDSVKGDFHSVLLSAPAEVAGLRNALVEGRINGSVYEGECACLVGTIANVRGCDYSVMEGLAPNANRLSERFFMGISKGDTPEKNPLAALAVEWIDEFEMKLENAIRIRTGNAI